MGKYLAKIIKSILSKKELNDIDVVIPIPDTSRNSALPISLILKKELMAKSKFLLPNGI